MNETIKKLVEQSTRELAAHFGVSISSNSTTWDNYEQYKEAISNVLEQYRLTVNAEIDHVDHEIREGHGNWSPDIQKVKRIPSLQPGKPEAPGWSLEAAAVLGRVHGGGLSDRERERDAMLIHREWLKAGGK